MSGKKRKVQKLNRNTIVLLILVAIFLCAVAWYRQQLHTVDVSFTNQDGSTTAPLQVQIANDRKSISKGLMFVKEMPQNHGMLFVFPEEAVQSFWMKNTFISLDMLFIDKNRKVVGILHDVPPLNEKPRKIDKPSRFVLEVNAGVARSLGIDRGSIINVPLEAI